MKHKRTKMDNLTVLHLQLLGVRRRKKKLLTKITASATQTLFRNLFSSDPQFPPATVYSL